MKILFVGDIVGTEGQPLYRFDSHVASWIREHEVAVCNFEAPVTSAGKKQRKAGGWLHQHPSMASWIESGGFNVAGLANNHICDFGQAGIAATLASFHVAGTVGAGMDGLAAYSPLILERSGIKVGIFAFGEREFGALNGPESRKPGFAWVNHSAVNRLIRDVREQTDLLFVLVHAGVEDVEFPLPEWRARYRELIAAGADAVVASHPHIPQGWEMYNERPIFYSLGNFLFDRPADNERWNQGLTVTLEYNANRKLQAMETKTIRFDRPIIKFETDPDLERRLLELSSVLEGEQYDSLIERMVIALWRERYRGYTLSAVNGIDERSSWKDVIRVLAKKTFSPRSVAVNYPLLLHNLRIESHRWTVERALDRFLLRSGDSGAHI